MIECLPDLIVIETELPLRKRRIGISGGCESVQGVCGSQYRSTSSEYVADRSVREVS
jgi:hypothetical protein